MKTRMNFRLSEDALMSLARLSGLWGCDRTAVVERALAEADPSEEPGTLKVHLGARPSFPEPSDPGDTKERVVQSHPQKALTRAEREALTDAFQRQMAKGAKK